MDAEKDLKIRELYDTIYNIKEKLRRLPNHFTFWGHHFIFWVKALPKDSFVMHQDSVIVWIQQTRDLARELKIKELRNGTGTISKLD